MNFMKNITKYVVAAAFALVVMGAGVSVAQAGTVTFNTDPQDHATIRVTNASDNPNCNSCWEGSVTATYGETVNVRLYYHNTGNMTANDTKLVITPEDTNVGSSHTFTGKIKVGNTVKKTSTAYIYTPGNASLEFISGSIRWYPNQQDYTSPINGSQSNLWGSGVPIGNITASWSSQGYLVASYKVVNHTPNSNPCNDCNDPCDTNPCNDPCNGCNDPCDWYGCDPNPCNDCNDPCSNGCSVDDDEPEVTTVGTGSSYISDTSAVLFGDLDDLGDDDEADVWFEWGDADGFACFLNNETSHQSLDSTDNFDETVGGLEPGETYCYKAFAENQWGEVSGSTKYFTTDDEEEVDDNGGNNNNNGDDDLEIDTLTATSISNNSARLRGEVSQAAGDEVEVWFEWSDEEDIVEDGDGFHTSVSGNYEENDDFSRTISGLVPGDRYYFRACGFDPDTDGDDEDCGSVRSFVTDGGSTNNPPVNNDPGVIVGILPTVVTITSQDVTTSGATLSGGFNSNTSCDVTQGYFQYGRTTTLGSQSPIVPISDVKGVFFKRIEGLTPGATYFYRAVALSCNGLGYGSLRSFVTTGAAGGGGGTTVTTTVINEVVSGNGDGVLRLLIDDHVDTVVNGQISTYEVNWENISNSDLDRVEIEIQLPNEGEFLNTTRGQYNEDNHTVFIVDDNLDADDEGEAFITMRMVDRRGTETLVVASAVAVFEDPDTGARSNAIDFDDTQLILAGSALGASIFGSGFLPISLLGWLFLLLILFVIFVAVRYIAMRPAPRPVYYQVPTNDGYTPYQPAARG